jgi:hypothetical protein
MSPEEEQRIVQAMADTMLPRAGTSKRINSRDKGARAEREAAELLFMHLGVKAYRLRTPGEDADRGDLGGVPNTTIEVKNRDSLTSSLAGLEQCERAQERNGHDFGATLIRRPGGRWMVCLTPAQFAALWREATGVNHPDVAMRSYWPPEAIVP